MSKKDENVSPGDVRVKVREFYGGIANESRTPAAQTCCGQESGDDNPRLDSISRMYQTPDVGELPEEVTEIALGCGDPVTLASLQPGQMVLDLGSGGGIDCFLAARRVGETGHVIGVDMTPSMIEKARDNQAKLGMSNVEFRLGEIEHLPVADESVDVVISNCVINLSPDKPQVFHEAFRALRPGGLLAISDIMTDGPLPDAIRNSISAWAGCVGGALDERDYLAAIKAAGFIDIEVTREYMDCSEVEVGLEGLELGEDVKAGRHAVLRVGEHVQVIDLGDDAAYNQPIRTFSGKVKARKPA